MFHFFLFILLFVLGHEQVSANSRYSDPDGCLSCHAYKGLDYIDEFGVMRSATIDSSHYASSLHGGVPCKDCHREVVDYPHEVENTEADCSDSCHIEEPSEGVKYSHDIIHEEMDKSVHAGGWFKGLTGGNRLEEIEDRLAEINGLKRKFGNDITEILKRRDQIAEELQQLASNDENMKALEEELRQKEKVLSKLAIRLAEKRESAAKSFTASVEKELKELSMGNVQFGVRFDYPSDPDGFILFRKEKMKASATGLGTLEFMFSPNPGEELRPLVKIASGGEVSRVMLALKSILNDQDTIPVMIFDEVDTGIGGGVAEKVGLKLQKVASTKQVLCITHLPQIAGLASSHFRIEKQIKSKRTHSTIHQLEHEERVEELARMSSGETITDASLEHAREMLRPAR